MGTLPRFYALCQQLNNFYDFLFAALKKKHFQMVNFSRTEIDQKSKVCPLRAEPSEKGSKNKIGRVPSSESVPIHPKKIHSQNALKLFANFSAGLENPLFPTVTFSSNVSMYISQSRECEYLGKTC